MSCSYSPVMVTYLADCWSVILADSAFTDWKSHLAAEPDVTWDWIGFLQYSALLFVLPTWDLWWLQILVNETKPKVVSEFVV